MQKPFNSSQTTKIPPRVIRPGHEPNQPLPNGFYAAESTLVHESLSLAGFQWFDGDKVIMGKKLEFEVFLRPGQSQAGRWMVMGFPLYDMNAPNAAEVCLHFLAEAFAMAHMLDFQYQVAINMESEKLEFLIQLPLEKVTASQLGELIRTFFDALAETILQDLSEILNHFEAHPQ